MSSKIPYSLLAMETGGEDRFERDENASALDPALRLEGFFYLTIAPGLGSGVT
jgi:hypothetical protein